MYTLLPDLPVPELITVHVSTRVVFDLDLLVPYDDVNAAVISGVAMAVMASEHVRLHALTCLANHMDLIVSAPANAHKKFVGQCKRNIAKRLRQLGCPMKGTFWQTSVVTPLATHEAQVRALTYVFGRGVEEGMFARPGDWQGVHCVNAIASGQLLSGGSQFVGFAFLDFVPIPAWAHLSRAQQQLEAQDLVAKVIATSVVAQPTIGLVRNEAAFAEALRRRFNGDSAGLRLVA